MGLFDNRFASKNAAQARAWSTGSGDKSQENVRHQSQPPKVGICDKCHREAPLKSYRSRQTDIVDGAASFGTVVKHLCVDCAPKSRRERDENVPQLNNKQLKNLMRSAKKGLLK